MTGYLSLYPFVWKTANRCQLKRISLNIKAEVYDEFFQKTKAIDRFQKRKRSRINSRKACKKRRMRSPEKMGDLLSRYKKIDEEFYEELEEILISADVGVTTVMDLIDDLRDEVKKQKIEDANELQPILSEKLAALLKGGEDG